jgi:hypothetical protein
MLKWRQSGHKQGQAKTPANVGIISYTGKVRLVHILLQPGRSARYTCTLSTVATH